MRGRELSATGSEGGDDFWNREAKELHFVGEIDGGNEEMFWEMKGDLSALC